MCLGLVSPLSLLAIKSHKRFDELINELRAVTDLIENIYPTGIFNNMTLCSGSKLASLTKSSPVSIFCYSPLISGPNKIIGEGERQSCFSFMTKMSTLLCTRNRRLDENEHSYNRSEYVYINPITISRISLVHSGSLRAIGKYPKCTVLATKSYM